MYSNVTTCVNEVILTPFSPVDIKSKKLKCDRAPRSDCETHINLN